MSRGFGLRQLLAVVVLVCVGLALPAEASHFRGVDMWATIDANGVVKLTARTRWRKGAQPFPFAGIDSSRFGQTQFNCDGGGPTVTLTPASGMRIIRVSDGATVFTWANNSFSMTATTTGSDMSRAGYDERTQVLTIPLGNVSAAGQINTPRNLLHGAYDIVWNDWSRIRGIRNVEPFAPCGGPDSGFGGRVRVLWNGTASGGPDLSASFQAVVPRGFEYSQNLNAKSPAGRSLAYRLSPLNPRYPVFGPASQIPGLTLDQTGLVRIPASQTSGLLDNYFGEPGGAYVLAIEVEDSAGWISRRDGLLAPTTTTNRPPVLEPIASRTIQVGQTLSFTVRATDPDGHALTLTASGLPPGATFTAAPGSSTGTFSWTPSASQVDNFGINFEVSDSGTPELGGQDRLFDSTHATITVQDVNRSPRLEYIANLRVGADPLRIQAFVSQTLQFDAEATDPNTGDVLTYGLPILLDPNAVNRAGDAASLGFTATTVTTPDGRRIGRYTWTPAASAIGVWQATVRVDDGRGASDERVVVISVGTFPNQSPVFSVRPPQDVFIKVGETVSFPMSAFDPDSGQSVTLRVNDGHPPSSNFPHGATGNPVSATFSWTPTRAQAGVYTVTFTASDDGSPVINQPVTTVIHVAPDTQAPPSIFSLTPNRGPTSGGTQVLLRGGGFTGTVGVTIGGRPVGNLQVVDSAMLTFLTPPGTQGPADVVVSAAGGSTTLVDGYLYTVPPPPPSITSPVNGSFSTSTVVTVSGSGVPEARLDIFDGGTLVGSLVIGTNGSFSGSLNLGYGQHSLTFTQTNETGTSQPAGPIVVTVIPPAPVITAPAQGFTSSGPSVGVTVAGLPGARAFLYDGAVQVGEVNIGTGGTGSTQLTLGCGPHALSATQVFAGQTSARSGTVSGVVLPPAPTLFAPRDGDTSTSRVVSVSGAGVGNATVNVFDNGGALSSLTADGAGRFGTSLTLDFGVHVFTFSQTCQGVTGPATGAIRVTLVPPAPVITSPASGYSSLDRSVTVTGTGVPNAEVALYDNGTQVGTVQTDGGGSFSTALTLAPGVHSLTATQRRGGQTSASSAAVSVTILPPAPVITAPVDGFTTTQTTVAVRGSGLAGATVTVYDLGRQVDSFTVGGNGSLSHDLSLDHGTHVLTFTQSIAGVTGPSTGQFTVHVYPAAPVLVTPANGFDTTERTVAYSGTGVPFSRVVVTAGPFTDTAFADGLGHFSGSLTLGYGVHVLSATQEKGGLTSVPGNRITVYVRPAAPVLTAPVNGFDTTETTVAFAGTGIAGSSVTVTNGSVSRTVPVDGAGRFSGTLTTGYGVHTLVATQENGGLTSAASNRVTVRVRPAAPVITAPTSGFDTTSTTVAFAGTGVPGSDVTVTNGTVSSTVRVDGSGRFSGSLTVGYGEHSLVATQQNGGLASAPSNRVTVRVRPTAPVITSPPNGFDTTETTVAFAGTGVPGSLVTVTNGTVSATASVDGSGRFSGSLTVSHGVHVLVATQENGGLTSAPSNSVTVSVRPAAPVITVPVSGFDTTDTTVAYAGTGVPHSRLVITNGTVSDTVFVDALGNFSGTLTLGYGVHVLSATQENGGLTSAPSNSVTVYVRPAAPVITVPTSSFDTTNRTVAFAGTGVPGSVVTVTNGTVSVTAGVDDAGQFSGTLELDYGVHVLSATQENGGLTSASSNTVQVYVRPAAPSLTLPTEGFDTTDRTVAFAGTGVPGSLVTVTNGTVRATATVDGSGHFSGSLTVAYGVNVLSATQSQGGLTSAPSNSVTVRVRPVAPVITVPSSGFDTTNTTVAFSGTGVPDSTVTLTNGTVSATATVDGSGYFSGSITVAYGVHTLVATQENGGLTSVPSNSVTVYVRPAAPVITVPASGFDTTDTTVAFAGTGVPGSLATVTSGAVSVTVAVDDAGRFSGALVLDYGVRTLVATQSQGGLTSVPSNTITVYVRPAAPVITVPTSGFDTTETTVAFVGTGVPGSVVTVTNGTVSVNVNVDEAGAFSGALTLDYGVHTLVATQENGGLTSAPSNSVTVYVRPPVPLISAPVHGQASVDPVVLVRGVGVPGATVEAFDGETRVGTFLADEVSGAFEGTITLAPAAHVLTFHQTRNGLTSARTVPITVYIIPGPPLITAPVDGDDWVGTIVVAVAGQGVPNAVVNVFDAGIPVGTLDVDASGNISGSLTLDYGVRSLTFTQTNSGGTSAATAPIRVTLRPAAPLIIAPIHGSTLQGPDVLVRAQGVPGATLNMYNRGVFVGSLVADTMGSYAGTLTLGAGAHGLTFSQTAGGVTGPAAGPVIIAVNTVIPGNNAAYLIDPAQETRLTTEDGKVTVILPAGAVASPSVLTIVQEQEGVAITDIANFAAAGTRNGKKEDLRILPYYYQLQLDLTAGPGFPAGLPATVQVELPATGPTTSSYRKNTLVLAETENGAFEPIPNCDADPPDNSTPDGRCTEVTALTRDGKKTTDYELSAPVRHF